MEINQKIIEQCGIKPTNVELIIVGNDPNFVFANDPNFQTVVLYDIEGNVINVNSWLECANYVNGGWVNNLDVFINEERILFFTILLLTLYAQFSFSMYEFYLEKFSGHQGWYADLKIGLNQKSKLSNQLK